MKIGIVGYPTYGGSGMVATELGLGLAKSGHQVHFITYKQPVRFDVFNQNVSFHEVPIRSYPLFDYPPYELALASRMVNVVEYEKLDVLHVHYAIPHASAAFMAKQILATKGISIPVVTTLHGTDITLVGKDESYAPVVSFSINQSDQVTAVSESLKQETYEHFEVTRAIDVVPNFVDLSKFQRNDKSHFRKAICDDSERIVVHISNFRKVKRVEDVIAVFARLLEHQPARLLLAGDGPERPRMERLCRELGICDHIRFLGKIDVIEDVLSVADLFLMTSEKESFGLAALEAMACQVPVISTDAGGLPELNLAGVSGEVSAVGDVEAMSQQALKILHADNLERYRQGAFRRAQDFAIEKVLPLYEAVYEKALSPQQA